MAHWRFLVLLLAGLATTAWAVGVGDTLAPLALADQHGKPLAVDASVRRLYFTHDMAGGKLLKAALGDGGQAHLDAGQAVAVTDVSGMPAMIRRMMALPAMKKRSYRIGVDETGQLTAGLPRQPEQVTVIELDRLAITAVHYAADEKSLRAMVTP